MRTKPGDILLFKGMQSDDKFTKIFEWLIKRVTKSNYCHVAILLDPKNNTVAQALPKGFSVSNYNELLDTYISNGKVDVYRCKDKLTDEQVRILTKTVRNWEGVPYDWLDIVEIGISYIFHKKTGFRRSNALICSEAVDIAFQIINVDLVPNKDSDMVTPGDVALSDKLYHVN